jgi:hypothetical protein
VEESEKLEGTIAGQTFSFQARDLLPILLLCCAIVGGYLVWLQIDKRFELFQTHHMRLFELFLEDQKQRREQTALLVKQLTILDYNLRRPPDEHIPLGLNGPPPPKPGPP